MNKKILCPICSDEIEIDVSNSYRPFCSKRCRLIDLGQWVNEEYSISEQTSSEHNIDNDPSNKH
jgi:uncharacterized protein